MILLRRFSRFYDRASLLNRKGGQVLATATSRKLVRLSNASSGVELATLETPERLVLSWLAFSPDATQLAIALANGPIQVWDLRQVRAQLASMNLDWDMPPHPQITAPLARTGK